MSDNYFSDYPTDALVNLRDMTRNRLDEYHSRLKSIESELGRRVLDGGGINSQPVANPPVPADREPLTDMTNENPSVTSGQLDDEPAPVATPSDHLEVEVDDDDNDLRRRFCEIVNIDEINDFRRAFAVEQGLELETLSLYRGTKNIGVDGLHYPLRPVGKFELFNHFLKNLGQPLDARELLLSGYGLNGLLNPVASPSESLLSDTENKVREHLTSLNGIRRGLVIGDIVGCKDLMLGPQYLINYVDYVSGDEAAGSETE